MTSTMNATNQQPISQAVTLTGRQVALLRRGIFILKRQVQQNADSTAIVAELNRLDQIFVDTSAKP